MQPSFAQVSTIHFHHYVLESSEIVYSCTQALLGNAKSSSKNLNSPEIPIYNSK